MVSVKKFSIALVGAVIITTATNPVNAITLSLGGTSVAGQGKFSSLPNVTTIDFNDGTVPSSGIAVYSTPTSTSTSFAKVVSGHHPNLGYAQPTDDKTPYFTITRLGANTRSTPLTINFSSAMDYFGFYWGAVDPWNTVKFYKDNTLISKFTGGDVINKGLTSNSEFVNFFAAPGESFDKVILELAPAWGGFETDNHAYRVYKSVPEPSSVLGLLAFGTFAISSLLKRKRQQKVLASVASE